MALSYNKSMKELLGKYDFGTRQDMVTEEGDVIAAEVEERELLTDDELLELYEENQESQHEVAGVAVDVNERRRILGEVAAIYAKNARADGMVKALDTPHRRELGRRYPDPEKTALNARSMARAALRDVPSILAPLLKTDELIEAGFDPEEARNVAAIESVSVQHEFGVTKKASERNASLRRLYNPAKKRQARPRSVASS